ncbi:MAG TPA: sulfotransferase [Gemmatimonadales bacterium]|nr:sulfotransferase [Gemmatimonadales bacterium]
MTQIVKPIILVGTGRCGSTLFHTLLSSHEQVMWLNGFAKVLPGRPAINRWATTAMGNRLVGRLLRGAIYPMECYEFWDRYAYGFGEPRRDLVRSDVSARVKRQLNRAFGALLTRRRHRLLIKVTGWSRIGYLDEVFEDARFIHIMRDGRSVASSMLHIEFWNGWSGPPGWRAGPLSPEDQAIWERYERSFIALAGIEWRIQMRAIDAARRQLDPRRFMEIRYERFCEQPMETLHRVLEFADLPPSRTLERAVKDARIKSTKDRWREDLAPVQQTILDEVLRDDLRRYGYDDTSAPLDDAATAGARRSADVALPR